jgi:hypothetical protein
MPIIRVQKHASPYVIIEKTGLDDTRLSFRARGILAYLLSKPDHWSISIAQLASQSGTEGMDAIRSALKELVTYGYAERKLAQGEDGKLRGWETIIYERPQAKTAEPQAEGIGVAAQAEEVATDQPTTVLPTSDEPTLDKPTSVLPISVLPTSANPRLVINDLSKELGKAKKERKPLSVVSPQKKPTPRASQLPADWIISPAIVDWGRTTFPYVNLPFEADKFRDHYRANGKPMKDWDAAFRNWVRKSAEMNGHVTHPQPPTPRKLVY